MNTLEKLFADIRSAKLTIDMARRGVDNVDLPAAIAMLERAEKAVTTMQEGEPFRLPNICPACGNHPGNITATTVTYGSQYVDFTDDGAEYGDAEYGNDPRMRWNNSYIVSYSYSCCGAELDKVPSRQIANMVGEDRKFVRIDLYTEDEE